MKKFLWLFAFCLVSAAFVRTAAETEDFAAAVSAGKVSVTFRGTGGSSGDAIEAIVVATPKTSGHLVLTVAPGTRLQSGNSSAQNMVIAGVKGQMMDANRYEPSSEIQVSNTPRTYIFEAYCTNFEKDNPSAETGFALETADPILAAILSEPGSTTVKQAAVWIYTDNVSYGHLNQKFTVSPSDWDAAVALVKKCSAPPPAKLGTPPVTTNVPAVKQSPPSAMLISPPTTSGIPPAKTTAPVSNLITPDPFAIATP